jgi:hypothetical protein
VLDGLWTCIEPLLPWGSNEPSPGIQHTTQALPRPPAVLEDEQFAVAAVRLANDMRTYERERREGTPNAVTLLVGSDEPVRDALFTVRHSLDAALADPDTEIATLPSSLVDRAQRSGEASDSPAVPRDQIRCEPHGSRAAELHGDTAHDQIDLRRCVCDQGTAVRLTLAAATSTRFTTPANWPRETHSYGR